MTEATFDRRLQQLIRELQDHPHCKEILELARQQLQDDTLVLQAEVF